MVEDSVNQDVYEHIKKKWNGKLKLFLTKKKRANSINCGHLCKVKKTPYIFHCEDDWVYTRGNFIEDSLKILKTDDKIIQVWLERRKCQ